MNDTHEKLIVLLDKYEKYLVIKTKIENGKVVIKESLDDNAPNEAVEAFEEKEKILSSDNYEPIR